MKEITIQAPATVANLVCGFDVLGMALEEPFDIMELRLLDKPGVTIISRDGFPLPTDPAQNTAGAPLLAMLEEQHGVLGGENSGHIVCLDRVTTGDGIVAALQVLQALHVSGQTLADARAPVKK